jgi:chaperonin cofactor prefoldin
MGATETAKKVRDSLNSDQRSDLAAHLEKRKEELKKALEDIQKAIDHLNEPPPTS